VVSLDCGREGAAEKALKGAFCCTGIKSEHTLWIWIYVSVIEDYCTFTIYSVHSYSSIKFGEGVIPKKSLPLRNPELLSYF
jgi:hypothetical protein